jgi:co-chaperonin GroES (HSP10)
MQTTNYITTGSRVYISAFKDEKRIKNIKGPDGPIPLYIPGDWNEFDEDYVKQDGIAIAVPDKAMIPTDDGKKRQVPVQIAAGEKVYTHHHLCHEDNGTLIVLDNGLPVWSLEYDQCYCTVSAEGTIKALGQWVLCEPIKDNWTTETGVYKIHRVDKKKNYAIVRHISDLAKEELPELKEGDKVLIHERGGYVMKVEGKDYFRTRIKDIQAIMESADA